MDLARLEAVMWRNRALLLFDRIAMPVAVCDVYGAVLLANPAMAAECGTTPGRLRGRDVLELFSPREATQVERIAEALRLRHRSRYQVSVRWRAPGGAERYGELTADPVSDTVEDTPALLVMLRVEGERERPRADPSAGHPRVTPVEARILALLAGGATTARAARETGLTTDGVTYHLRRLSSRWNAANRTELVARAYALGVLTPGVWPPEASVPE
ncbi:MULTISPECIES: PAS domain S-box protein [unclassified Streptomyces]|uniref:PAS domain S-box protein n=1 Tax=unclassified Streptomyces TaxID=2593676 RepID=UPI00339E1A3D